MSDLFKKFPRSFATILVTLLTIITNGTTNFDGGLDFFTDIFSGAGAPLAAGLTLLLIWIGERKIISFDITPTVASIIGVIGIALATFLGPAGMDLQEFLGELTTNGEVWLGGLLGVLSKIFGDRQIDIFIDAEQIASTK